jgi:hypothetical protein
MTLEWSAAELDLLLEVIDAAQRDRLRQIHHSDSREYRQRLEREAATLRGIQERLERWRAQRHLNTLVDERVEETFPASDPPAQIQPGR